MMQKATAIPDKKFKKLLNIAGKSLKSGDPALDMFYKLCVLLDKIDVTKIESIPLNIRKMASEIHKEAKKGVNKHGEMV